MTALELAKRLRAGGRADVNVNVNVDVDADVDAEPKEHCPKHKRQGFDNPMNQGRGDGCRPVAVLASGSFSQGQVFLDTNSGSLSLRMASGVPRTANRNCAPSTTS